MTAFVELAALADLADGTSTMVDHAGQKVLLVRLGDDLRAYDGRCPHARTPLAAGPLLDGDAIECPMHGAIFRACDGALEPGPVTCPDLTAWPVRERGGRVEVRVPEPAPAPRAGRPQSWGAVGARTTATTESTG